jgi:hypothetical protein
VATSPDPDDPEAVQRRIEEAREKERVVDERLDPYSARYFPKEPRTEELARVVRQERMVEGIVRGMTWEIVKEKCGVGTVGDVGWEEAVERWEKEQSGGSER